MANKRYVNSELNQFICFCIVGVINTVINYASYLLLLIFVASHYIFAGSVAFLLGAVCGFFMNRAWTFGKNGKVLKNKLWIYLLVNIFSLSLNMLVLYIGVTYFGVSKLYAQLFGIVVTTFSNYAGVKLFVFKA